jgi:hypothetical protein
MKQMKNFGLAAMAALAFFTSCNHHDDPYEVTPQSQAVPPGTDNNRTASPIADNAATSVSWRVGYIGARNLSFNGDMITASGNIWPISTRSESVLQADIFKPAFLGTLKVPYGTYSRTQLRMIAGPNAYSKHGLYLEGSYLSNGIQVPVQIIMDNEIEMKGETSTELKVDEGNEYMSRVSFDLAELTRGLNSATLDNMKRENGAVIISVTSNLEAYRMIVDNMQRTLRIRVR